MYHVYTWCFKALGLYPVSRIINHSLLNIFGPVLHSNLSVILASSVQSRNSTVFKDSESFKCNWDVSA